jgi:predicted nucleic acid-binding protein
MEVLAGSKTAEHEDVVDMFLRDFRVVEITRLIARDAVALRRVLPLRLPDAIIWASARAESALLVTRDTRDFPKDDPGVRVPY